MSDVFPAPQGDKLLAEIERLREALDDVKSLLTDPDIKNQYDQQKIENALLRIQLLVGE